MTTTKRTTGRHPFKAKLTSPKLSAVAISGSSHFVARDVQSEALHLEVSGSGDMSLEGRTQGLELAISGSGTAKLSGLEAERATVTIKGSGDASIKATKYFAGTVTGSGDIDVHGNPAQYSSNVIGSGTIEKK